MRADADYYAFAAFAIDAVAHAMLLMLMMLLLSAVDARLRHIDAADADALRCRAMPIFRHFRAIMPFC